MLKDGLVLILELDMNLGPTLIFTYLSGSNPNVCLDESYEWLDIGRSVPKYRHEQKLEEFHVGLGDLSGTVILQKFAENLEDIPETKK